MRIEVSVDEAMRMLSPERLEEGVRMATLAVGTDVQRMMKSYPRRRHDIHVRFKTDRQRRWFFWALRTKRITVPYIRTGRLMRGWKLRTVNQHDAEVSNSVPYAKWVQAERVQSYYHRRVPWQTDEKVADVVRRSPRTRRLVVSILAQELGR